jgi:hypothetical protein
MSRPLKCPGVGRDKDCISALQFYFNRPVTDDEMRFLHEVVQRAAVCMPETIASRIARTAFVEKFSPGYFAFDEHSCPGHVASENDPKVCGRCGTHIDSLRPSECDL